MTSSHKTNSRNFRNLLKDEHRQIASAGGKRAHELGRAYTWNSADAREAGRKGGLTRSRNAAARKAAQTSST